MKCINCGVELGDVHPNKKFCTDCARERQRESCRKYFIAHREEIHAQQKRYRWRNSL